MVFSIFKRMTTNTAPSQPISFDQSSIETYVPDLQKMLASLSPNSLKNCSPAENAFIQRVKSLPNTLAGAHRAYNLVNDFILASEKQPNPKSPIKALLLPLHTKMLSDPALNWFGTPRPAELQKTANLYGGEAQYNQRMECFLTHAAEKIGQGKEKLTAVARANTRELNSDFLHAYVQGQLSPEQLKILDNLENGLKENEIDFFTVQTSFQLYRYLIAEATATKNSRDFMHSRSGMIPIKFELGQLTPDQCMQRFYQFLPEGELKSNFIETNDPNPMGAKEQLKFNIGYYPNLGQNPYFMPGEAETPLTSPHYRKFMDAMLNEMKQPLIKKEVKGLLPVYRDEQGKLMEALFSVVGYPDSFSGRKDAPAIQNVSINKMVKELGGNEKYPGENFYKHLSRLFTIALLTPYPEVREEARCRLEWWYSNIMPYSRGSAAVSEGLSKLPLLVNHILPTQMRGHILPDLGAICQYSEEEYIKHHNEFYANPPGQLVNTRMESNDNNLRQLT